MRSELKTFFVKFGWYLPIPLAVIATNFWVDPANLIHRSSYIAGAASLIAEGKPVANLSNFDERLLRKLMILNVKEFPSVINLGSSSTQFINTGFFPGERFYNLYVSAASIEDYLALFELCENRGFQPETILIGTDIWLLNKEGSVDRWRSLYPEYKKLLRELLPGAKHELVDAGQVRWKLQPVLECLSPTYFRKSIETVWENRKRTRSLGTYYVPEQIDREFRVMMPDGSSLYSEEELNRTPEQASRIASDFARDYVFRYLPKFQQLDPQKRELFEAFVNRLQSSGAKIKFILPPIHPTAYEYITERDESKIHQRAEAYFREFAMRHGIECHGSFDPSAIPCDASEFFDAGHPSVECIRRILSKSD
jgi:hypothetical protein